MNLFQFFIDNGFEWFYAVRFCMLNLLIVLLFHRLPSGQHKQGLRILGCLCLAIPLPINLMPNLIGSVLLRFCLQFFNVAGYLFFYKKADWRRCFYFSGIWQILHTLVVDINMTPLFNLLRHGKVPTASYDLNMALSLLVEYGFYFVICALFSHYVNLSGIHHIEKIQAGVVVFFNIILQYEKFVMKQWAGNVQHPTIEQTVYPILMSTVLFISIIFFHRYLNEREQREQYRLLSAITQQQLQNAQAIATVDSDIHRLYHDMKNHLIAIRSLSEGNGSVADYVDGLMENLSAMDYQLETGNSVLNGLLSEKLHIAQTIPASLNIYLDFSAGSFLAATDICVIFGNALDNALEAVKSIADPEERIISVRSGFYANTLILDFTNPYLYAVSFGENGLPISSKGDDVWHGIGLSSIQQSVEKYDGTIAIDTSQGDLFRLKIMIPLPDQDGPSETVHQ